MNTLFVHPVAMGLISIIIFWLAQTSVRALKAFTLEPKLAEQSKMSPAWPHWVTFLEYVIRSFLYSAGGYLYLQSVIRLPTDSTHAIYILFALPFWILASHAYCTIGTRVSYRWNESYQTAKWKMLETQRFNFFVACFALYLAMRQHPIWQLQPADLWVIVIFLVWLLDNFATESMVAVHKQRLGEDPSAYQPATGYHF